MSSVGKNRDLLRRFSILCAFALGVIGLIIGWIITSIVESSDVPGVTVPVWGALAVGFTGLHLLLRGIVRRIAADVSDSRLFQDQQELAGRLLSLMNNVPGLVYRGCPDWSVRMMGAEAERITGYAAEEFLSGAVKWRDLIHPGDRGAVEKIFRDAVRAKEKVLRTEYRIRHRDGSPRWLADRRQLIYDAQGVLQYIDGLILDISARKRSEERLRLTQFSVDRAGDAAYWMGPDGRLLYVNEHACRVLGYTREELLSMSIQDINPGYPKEAWPAHWEEVRRRKSFTVESCHRAKNGSLIPVEVTVNYLEFDGKEYNCASARDVTERKRAQEESRRLQDQLLRSQKMEALGILAGGIAHDFNNLLTGILGYANLLAVREEPEGEVAKAARVIQAAAERASHLTAQLLGCARRGKNLTVPLDLHRTVAEVTVLLERTLDKRIVIRTDLHASDPVVSGDPAQMHQIIMNLAVNAGDAMPEGGTLTLATGSVVLDEADCRSRPETSPGRHIFLSVADTGTGIPEGDLERIFDPFFTTKGPGKGTGLGLATVFGIVRNHGGWIEVESLVGSGSTFKVYLPVATGVELPRDAAPDPGIALGSARGTILLVDDQETVREVATAMLSALGYDVITACDGCEGVEAYRRHALEIDLVIVDMVMPNMNGRDCLREIKRMNPDIRTVLSTGFSLDGAVQETMMDGVAGFIQKPYRMEELSQVVSKSLGRYN